MVAACKQGKGDRCQITADCQDPLVCSQATGTCTDMTTGGIDATVPIDAPRDAPTDAPRDASVID
ncbi:MAG: hypothetical protein ACM31C_03780 [Acidobacteriota bacterium]